MHRGGRLFFIEASICFDSDNSDDYRWVMRSILFLNLLEKITQIKIRFSIKIWFKRKLLIFINGGI